MSAVSHEFLPEEIMAFLDGELSDERAAEAKAHLESCGECRLLMSDLKGVSEKMKTWRVPELPQRAAQRINVVLLAERERQASASGFWNWLVARRSQVAVACGAALAGLLLIASIAPNLMKSRDVANEASAVGSLNTLTRAIPMYSSSYGHYPPALANLGPPPDGSQASEQAADLVDSALASGRKAGYFFTYRLVPAGGDRSEPGYEIEAEPVQPGSTGNRSFSVDERGILFADGQVLDTYTGSTRGQTAAPAASKAELSPSAPMIARIAELRIVVTNLDASRVSLNEIIAKHGGYIGQLSAGGQAEAALTLTTSLLFPADRLNLAVEELKKLGRVQQEVQNGEEVTKQYVDLVARIKNARNTEAKLNQVLQQHTGSVKDILEVEKEAARVRDEIESQEAERKNLENRVKFATVTLYLREEVRQQINFVAPSAGTRLWNALVEGFRNVSDTALAIAEWALTYGPTLIFLAILFFWPARIVWRRLRREMSAPRQAQANF